MINATFFIFPIDCLEIQRKGRNTTGVYEIKPDDTKIKTRCDMETGSGGWTVSANYLLMPGFEGTMLS